MKSLRADACTVDNAMTSLTGLRPEELMISLSLLTHKEKLWFTNSCFLTLCFKLVPMVTLDLTVRQAVEIAVMEPLAQKTWDYVLTDVKVDLYHLCVLKVKFTGRL